MSPLPRQAELAQSPLPGLLFTAYKERFSGCFNVVTATGPAQLWLREGYPVEVQLPEPADLLGEVLLANGAIDQAIHLWSAANLTDGKLYGRALIEAGFIEEEQLRSGLRGQVRRRVQRLFPVESGAVTVEGSKHDRGVEGGELLRIHPRRAIYQGIRGGWSGARTLAALGPLLDQRVRLTVDTSTLERYSLAADDLRLATLLADRPRSVEELASGAGCDIEAACALVCTFHFTAALEATPMRAAPPRPAQTPSTASTTKAPPPTLPVNFASTPQTPPVSPPVVRPPAFKSNDLTKLRKTIVEKAASVEKQSLFEVLGLPTTAGTPEVKAAYLSAVKLFHPDRVTAAGMPDLHGDATRIFQRVCEAHAVLSDESQRSAYLKTKDQPPISAEATATVIRTRDAELAFLRGEVLFKRTDYVGAIAELTRAVELNPQEGEHLALLAWSRVAAKQATIVEVKADLQAALKKSPRCARANYYLGMVLREEGETDAAISSFRKAVEIDPRLIEAASELRVLNLRRQKDTTKGLLDRLRKK